MSFQKTASVATLAVATSDGSSLNKTAAYEEDNLSNYMSGRRGLDIKAALEMVAEAYDISSNPGNYIFEAIRGNTVNVPNENKDAFHKDELLRFDHRLAKRVYETYQLKPHHINHRAENPKNARGFIVDAHYNDSSPALDMCPNDDCGNKTASVEGRDQTGIHCKKCGTVVKDEFIELLVAIDTQKDPSFADGVSRGVLRHGSMGCSCFRTRCNVCNNVAHTRSDFCSHIARSKGKEFDDSEPGFNPVAWKIVYPKDKTAGKPRKVAISHEWCEGTVFDEYSRVHDPADVKAEQYEILQLTAKVAELQNDDKLRHESEILVLQSKVAELERIVKDKLQKVAQKDSDVNIDISSPNGGPEDVEIDSEMPFEETPDLGTPIGELSPAEMGLTPADEGESMSAPAAGIAPPPPAAPPPRRGGKNKESVGGTPMLRFAESYKHLNAEITSAGNIRVFDKEGTMFVVKPENIDPNSKVAGKSAEDLARAVLTLVADRGIGGAISQTNAISGPRVAQVLDYYLDDMLNKDRMDTNSVTQEADDDTQPGRPSPPDSATAAGEETDRQDEHDTVSLSDDVLTGADSDKEDEHHERDPNNLSVLESHDSDMREKRKEWNMSDSAVDDVTLDHTEKAASKEGERAEVAVDENGHVASASGPVDIVASEGTASPDGTPPVAATKTAGMCEKCDCDPCDCKNASVAVKKHVARLEKLYAKRLAAKTEAMDKEAEEFKKTLSDRFARALKIASHRQALNLEYSALKTAMGIALCNRTPLGGGDELIPMDPKTAQTVVDYAFASPIVEQTEKPAWEANIDGLLKRAATIMEMGDQALMQVEADLKNVRTASVAIDDQPLANNPVDDNLRQAARSGNLQLAPSATDDNASSPTDKKRASIRDAVGTTRVASSRAGLGV